MDEQRPSEGGTANTPPFPRLVEDHTPDIPSLEEAPRPAAGEGPSHPDGRSDFDSFGASEPAPEDDEGLAPLVGAADPWNAPLDAETPADREARAVTSRFARRSREEGVPGEVRQRAAGGLHRGFERIAEQLEDAAERISQVAEEQLQGRGPNGRAGEVAQSTAEWMEGVADYLRAADLRQMQTDLERQVREKPLPTLLLAAGAGWLLGRIIR